MKKSLLTLTTVFFMSTFAIFAVFANLEATVWAGGVEDTAVVTHTNQIQVEIATITVPVTQAESLFLPLLWR